MILYEYYFSYFVNKGDLYLYLQSFHFQFLSSGALTSWNP